MSRSLVVVAARIAVAAVAAVLILAAPSQAALITLNFSGSVDLSSVDGGLPIHTFSGSITWNSAATMFEPAPPDPSAPQATYDPVSYTLIFDGVDYTAPVIGNGTGSGVFVINNGDPFGTGTLFDGLGFFLQFRPPFNVSGQPGDLAVVGAMVGPTTMFGSNALPGNLNFLSQLTGAGSLYSFEPDNADEGLIPPIGTLTLTIPGGPSFTPGPLPVPVPEPTTLALSTLGMAGALVRLRRSRKIS